MLRLVASSLLLLASLAGADVPLHAQSDAEKFDAAIRKGLRLNMEGKYRTAQGVWAELASRYPEHPAPHVNHVATLYWLMVHDERDTQYDEAIAWECAEALRKAEAMVASRPESAEAHLLLGQSYMQRGRLHGVNMEIYSAGTAGEKGRHALEHALTLDPNLIEAKLPLGLYHYYSSFVPSLVKWFGFLWFIPIGDGPTGLRYLAEVGESDSHEAAAARFHLSNIKTYHEEWIDRERALTLIVELHEQYPSNSLIHFELVELLFLAGRYPEVIAEALRLEAHPGEDRTQRGRVNMARIWRARSQLMLGHPDEAWRILEALGPTGPDNPNWGASWFHATRGQILDVLGQRERALAEYRLVQDASHAFDESRAMVIAQAGLERPFELQSNPPTIGLR